MAFFRIAFGALMVWEVLRYFAADRIRRFYLAPDFLFTYFGFEWVRPWAGDGMTIHFALLGALGLFILSGLAYRLSAALFFLGFTYVFLLDQSRYLNHFYLICLFSFLMIFVPAHRRWSLDALLGLTRRSEDAPAWGLWLLRAQIGLVYFFGGVAKLNNDWLQGEPMRRWLAERAEWSTLGPSLGSEAMVWVFAYGGLLFDLLVTPALLWRRSRPWAFAIAVMFHLTNAFVFRIGIFPWFMIAATTLFFEPDWPRRWLRRGGMRALPPLSAQSDLPLSIAARSTVLGLIALYLAVQLLVPLRHHIYPGDVSWTEEGHRFSWRMKLRSKEGVTEYFVTDPARQDTRVVDPARYLSPSQVNEMSTRPDMILQFAHFLASEARREGASAVEVRVMARVSLNGRQPHLLIDPRVDLAAQPRNLGSASWIMPLGEPLLRKSEEPR
jgi:vitamin K-dependent gamma-carboxylase